MQESTDDGVLSPDYLWNGKLWDLKSTSTEISANSAIRKGLKQIASNPGGVMLDFGDKDISVDDLLQVIEKRMKWYKGKTVDIMIVNKGNVVKILRYKK